MAESEKIWKETSGDGPLLATAIHDGHDVREDVAALLALDDGERLREEDPFTGSFTDVVPRRVVGRRSRFEVDLNRLRAKAVYRTPEDAWGLNVWKQPLPPELIERSLAGYDTFYRSMHDLIGQIIQEHGHVVVLDIHSYNHRRGGPDAPFDSPQENPVVNIGTGTLDRARWGRLVDRFIDEMRAAGPDGEMLDVRENVKFKGGELARWTHQTFGNNACVLSIEFKKVFMDEWSGVLDPARRDELRDALVATVPGLLEESNRI